MKNIIMIMALALVLAAVPIQALAQDGSPPSNPPTTDDGGSGDQTGDDGQPSEPPTHPPLPT